MLNLVGVVTYASELGQIYIERGKHGVAKKPIAYPSSDYMYTHLGNGTACSVSM